MSEIWQVDAFTEAPFAGNPAAVVPLERPAESAWMQALAFEMNLSETAFLWPEGNGWRLRWFTPTTEVRLCGHATLASAHVLWESGRLRPDRHAGFETLSGRLVAARRGDGSIELDFPSRPPRPVPTPRGLAEALGVVPVSCSASAEDFLVEVADVAAVVAAAPDFAALRDVPVRGVIVTAAGDAASGADFVSRFFAPRVGVDEDPVTGSAHAVLAPFWAARLGRDELVGAQLSRRGGRVMTRLVGERVHLGGRAVTIFRGDLTPAAAGRSVDDD